MRDKINIFNPESEGRASLGKGRTNASGCDESFVLCVFNVGELGITFIRRLPLLFWNIQRQQFHFSDPVHHEKLRRPTNLQFHKNQHVSLCRSTPLCTKNLIFYWVLFFRIFSEAEMWNGGILFLYKREFLASPGESIKFCKKKKTWRYPRFRRHSVTVSKGSRAWGGRFVHFHILIAI